MHNAHECFALIYILYIYMIYIVYFILYFWKKKYLFSACLLHCNIVLWQIQKVPEQKQKPIRRCIFSDWAQYSSFNEYMYYKSLSIKFRENDFFRQRAKHTDWAVFFSSFSAIEYQLLIRFIQTFSQKILLCFRNCIEVWVCCCTDCASSILHTYEKILQPETIEATVTVVLLHSIVLLCALSLQ